ncbi:MAG: hypothetical protein HQL90_01865 [Magnetococcales bacterium]|nr:hypothetical protein [Magnetococcales bacterium]
MKPDLPEQTDHPISEQHLDQLLAEWPASLPSAHLRNTILSLPVDTAQPREVFIRWPVTSWWHPAAILACSALLGLGLGMLWETQHVTPSPVDWQETMMLVYGHFEEAQP